MLTDSLTHFFPGRPIRGTRSCPHSRRPPGPRQQVPPGRQFSDSPFYPLGSRLQPEEELACCLEVAPSRGNLPRRYAKWGSICTRCRPVRYLNTNPIVVLTPFLTRYTRFTARFKDIFKPPEGTKVHFVVGNHDVG